MFLMCYFLVQGSVLALVFNILASQCLSTHNTKAFRAVLILWMLYSYVQCVCCDTAWKTYSLARRIEIPRTNQERVFM